MKNKKTIITLVFFIAIFSATASLTGILSEGGPGQYEYESIRGKTVAIYGKGIYQHMSAEVAVQGIAQDVVTLAAAVPLLIISTLLALRGSLKARFVLAGTLMYFLVTYLFYTAMGMFNFLFLVYVALLGLSLFAFSLTLLSFERGKLTGSYTFEKKQKFAGGFLIFNSIAIGFLWLSIIVPPLTEGIIYPVQLEHYTTLIVQGFDLGMLLPAAFVSGILLLKKRNAGYFASAVYLVFLSILMTALTAKIIAMAINGVNVIPSAVIIPAFNLTSITCAVMMIKDIQE